MERSCRSPKADPTLIAGHERHFAAIAETLEQSIGDLSGRPGCRAGGARRHGPGGDRWGHGDHRLTARLRALRRFDLDPCLGRMVDADNLSVCAWDDVASRTALSVGCWSTGVLP
jgi:hypothetical protein